LLGVLALTVLAALPARADEIVTVSGRPGVTQPYLLMVDKSAPPKAMAVLFPGGEGLLALREEGGAIEFEHHSNFLVRTRGIFRDADVGIAIVDAPSDMRSRGMTDPFRHSSEHAADVGAIVKDLRARFPGARIFLVGTSRGTVSAAMTGRALGKSIDGVVLTSTVSLANRQGDGLSTFRFGDLQTPLLLVHHTEDACKVSPYSGVQRLAASYPLVSVHDGKPPEADACEGRSAHGYFGKEVQTVAAIKAWMLGQPFPKTIE
jgi:hypothetical protein